MKTSLLILQLFLLSCEFKTDSKTVESKTEFEITDQSIGKIKIGNSFNSVDSLFKEIKIENTESEGIFWPIKTVQLDGGHWIVIESLNGKEITSVETNSPHYKYKSIFSVGASLNKLIKNDMDISVFSDLGGIEFILIGTHLTFKIEPEMEQKYFDKGGEFPETLDFNAKIQSIKLIK